jgi:hypothetical protein
MTERELSAELFNEADRAELERRGLSVDDALWQLELLRRGSRPLPLDRPATVGDGIERLGNDDANRFVAAAETEARRGRVSKFVPASGAASRMFRELAEERDRGIEGAATLRFFDNLNRFPMLLAKTGRRTETLSSLLDGADGIVGLPKRPKALIPFHRYEGATRTALAEQLYEAARYATDVERRCRVHFTVSPEHQAAFQQHVEEIRPQLESRTQARFDVTFSIQDPATDTLSLTGEGELFRRDGALVFRPAGHGALLGNLEQLNGDIVVIKNIDNVVPEHAVEIVVRWKKILIGYAASLQEQMFDMVRRCRSGGERQVEEARSFVRKRFQREIAPGTSGESLRAAVIAALDRPLRLVGVVRNEGEPGGAPFWVRRDDGSSSLQIIESAQVDHSDPEQQKLWSSSTHFNPVDIVCTLRDSEGKSYPLREYVDHDAVFISSKSAGSTTLTALELPGLWNGAMAEWNSIAVEVPPATFAPVKTIFDLLRSEHQT